MATPGASPLADLRAAYALICAQIRDAMVNPQPSYSEKGRSISWSEYYASLTAREAELRKIPGVAPETNPSFEIHTIAR
jgi:hypothetical protein